MAKGQHPLEELTVAIDLVLVKRDRVETTNSFFEVMLKILRPKDFRKANCLGMH
jgi:hypothetical protein